MKAQPTVGLVITSRQLLVAQVAVATCSSVADQTLGNWEDHRICLGAQYDRLARRLHAVRELDESAGARIVDLLDDEGCPMVAVELGVSEAETRALRVAIERLRGILARTGDFDGALDDDLDAVAMALA